MKLYHGSYDKLEDLTVRAGTLFNLICQKSSTSKVGDEGRSGEFT